VAFCIALVTSAILLRIDFGPEWCEVKESGLACVRNWFNAAGNILAVVAAIAAAGFAWAGVKATTRETELSLIPRIAERLQKLHTITDIMFASSYFARQARGTAREINSRFDDNENVGQAIGVWSRFIHQAVKLEERIDELNTAELGAAGDPVTANWVRQARSAFLRLTSIASTFVHANTAKDSAFRTVVTDIEVRLFFQRLREDPSLLVDFEKEAGDSIARLDGLRNDVYTFRNHLTRRVDGIERKHGVTSFYSPAG
jgi:hypothetical protein